MDLSHVDVVIFTAALVHRPEVTDWEEYHRLNAQLPYRFAQYVKAQGVTQFAFFSSISVYDSDRSLPKGRVITAGSELTSPTLYGKSKIMGENLVRSLKNERFHVSIVRPSYVYGQGCRGQHLETFRHLARRLPVLPKAFPEVKMGMVYIDDLAELCWLPAS